MKKILLLCLTTLFALTTWAYDFYDETSGFYYNIVDGGVEVTYASDNKTDECTFTDDIIIPESVEYEGTTYTVVGVGEYAFYKARGLTSIELPSKLTYVGEYAFYTNYSATYVQSIVVPDLVKTVGQRAFAGNDNVEVISIGEGVEHIGVVAFQCMNAFTVYSFNPTPPEADGDIFSDYPIDHGGILYVPIGSRDLYLEVDPWYFYWDNILEIGVTPPSIETLGASNIDKTTATLTASYTRGSQTIMEQGFEYRSGSSETQKIKATSVSSEEMVADLEELQSNTLYYYRAYVTTTSATYYGEEMSFRTANDYSCCLDDIYYNITDVTNRTCEVTCLFSDSEMNSTAYSGDIDIPSTIEIDGIDYTVTGVGRYAFNYCNNLTSVKIPDTVTSLGSYAFEYCTSLKSVDIPSTLTSLPSYLFFQCTSLTDVTLPSNISSIPVELFCYCESLEEITIPESVTSIGWYGFGYCHSLKEITIPSSVKTIDTGAFYECTSFTSVVVPNSVTSLGTYVFAHCSNLEEVTLSESIQTLDRSVFTYCSNLKSIELPDALTSIGLNTFSYCTNLMDVKFGNSLKSIGELAFAYCGFEEITLPNSLETLDYFAFQHCNNLKSIIIPENVTTIKEAFGYCDNLTYAEIGKSVTDISDAFSGCSALEEVKFAENSVIETIGESPFYMCRSLTSINIPNSVTYIGGYAFASCRGLPEITLPSSLEAIHYAAFQYCVALRKVYSNNPTPPTCEYTGDICVFDGVDYDSCTLYVPAGSYDDYASAKEWEDFMAIVEMVGVETLSAGDVAASSAVLNGKITIGEHSMDVTEKGFEFWKEDSENVLTTIYLEDNDMSFNITNLDPTTTYTYRAFATTEDGTIYGENVTFTTLDDIPDGIDSIGMSGINGENVEGIYSTSGQKLNSAVKGVNIIRYTDGTTKKVLVK